jgi:hypothetical protein
MPDLLWLAGIPNRGLHDDWVLKGDVISSPYQHQPIWQNKDALP